MPKTSNNETPASQLPRLNFRASRASKPFAEAIIKAVGRGNISRALNALVVRYGPALIADIKSGKLVFSSPDEQVVSRKAA